MTLKSTLLRTHILRDCHTYPLSDVHNNYFVISGSEPSITQRAAGANMSVDVSAFSYVLAGVLGAKSSTTNVVIDAADVSNPRIDLLYLNTSGTLTISKGTAAAITPDGESVWQKYETPYPADFSATSGILLAEVLVPAGATTIVNADIRAIYVPIASKSFVTAPVEVDHGASSPVALGTAPANSIIEPIIRCTENESGVVLTIGDEDDADSLCTDALMPTATTSAPMITPLGAQYYSAAKALRATITTAGTTGKWNIQFRVTLVV